MQSFSAMFGFPHRRRSSGALADAPIVLRPLALSANQILENSAPGTIVGSILGLTPGSDGGALTVTAGSRFAISGGNIVAGATGTDFESATSHSITIRETKAAAVGNPKDTVLTITVVNQNDTNPNAFALTDQSGVAVNSFVFASTVVAGLGASDSVTSTIGGDKSTRQRKNGGAWVAGAITGVVNGDTIAVGNTASSLNSTDVNSTLTIGTTSDTFTSTTVGSGIVPAITRVTASGVIKRQGMEVSLAVEDDGTATSYRYDVQANGAHLTGVTIRDGMSTVTADFPYTTTSNTIQFDAPAALNLQPYTMTGDASSGGSWTGATAAQENFSHQSDFFTPNTRSAPTVTRQTASGVTPATFQISGPEYEGDNLRVMRFNSSDALQRTTILPITDVATGSPFTITMDSITDQIGTIAATDYFKFGWETADYATGPQGPSSGIASSLTTVGVSDPAGHRYWKFTLRSGSFAILRAIETATSIGGADNAQGRTYTYSPASAQSVGGGTPSSNYFDGNSTTLGALDTNTSGVPASITIDYGINVDLHELRLVSDSHDYSGFSPSDFTFAYSDNNTAFTNVVNVSGITWNATTDETKTWSW
jgi:hypothetical protein